MFPALQLINNTFEHVWDPYLFADDDRYYLFCVAGTDGYNMGLYYTHTGLEHYHNIATTGWRLSATNVTMRKYEDKYYLLFNGTHGGKQPSLFELPYVIAGTAPDELGSVRYLALMGAYNTMSLNQMTAAAAFENWAIVRDYPRKLDIKIVMPRTEIIRRVRILDDGTILFIVSGYNRSRAYVYNAQTAQVSQLVVDGDPDKWIQNCDTTGKSVVYSDGNDLFIGEFELVDIPVWFDVFSLKDAGKELRRYSEVTDPQLQRALKTTAIHPFYPLLASNYMSGRAYRFTYEQVPYAPVVANRSSALQRYTGLGDWVAVRLHTGFIGRMVHKITGLDAPCAACRKRQYWLNRLVPFSLPRLPRWPRRKLKRPPGVAHIVGADLL